MGQNSTGAVQSRSLTINYLMTFTLQGAIGIFTTDHLGLELGLALPFGVVSGEALPYEMGYPSGDIIAGTTQSGTGSSNHYLTNFQGIGDISLQPKLRLINPSRSKLGIALIAGSDPTHRRQEQVPGRGQDHFRAPGRGGSRVGQARCLSHRSQPGRAYSQHAVRIR